MYRLTEVFLMIYLLTMAATAFAEEPKKAHNYSKDDLLDGGALLIASQEICGFAVNQVKIEEYAVQKVPDLPVFLYHAKIRGLTRILGPMSGKDKSRHCTKMHDLAEAAGWLK